MRVHRCRKPKWETVSISYHSPPRSASAEGISEDAFDRMAFGASTITQRCSICGYLTADIVAGDARST